MKTVFVKGLDEQSALEMKQAFIDARVVRDKIVEILEHKIEMKHRHQEQSDFTKPAWSEDQAASMGYIKALREVLMLMSPDDNKPEKRPVGRPKGPTPVYMS